MQVSAYEVHTTAPRYFFFQWAKELALKDTKKTPNL